MKIIFDDKITRFLSKYQFVKFAKKDVILRADDTPEGIYYVLKGYVRMYSISPQGNELTLNIFKPGSFFPLTWALANIDNLYFYEALTPVDIYRAPKQDFLTFIESDKNLLTELNRRILFSLNSQTIRLQYLTMGSAKNRIINTLLMLITMYGEISDSQKTVIKIPVTHQDIANIASVTRETTSVEINKLEKDKLISKKGRFYLINDIKSLKDEALIINDDGPLPYNF